MTISSQIHLKDKSITVNSVVVSQIERDVHKRQYKTRKMTNIMQNIGIWLVLTTSLTKGMGFFLRRSGMLSIPYKPDPLLNSKMKYVEIKHGNIFSITFPKELQLDI